MPLENLPDCIQSSETERVLLYMWHNSALVLTSVRTWLFYSMYCVFRIDPRWSRAPLRTTVTVTSLTALCPTTAARPQATGDLLTVSASIIFLTHRQIVHLVYRLTGAVNRIWKIQGMHRFRRCMSALWWRVMLIKWHHHNSKCIKGH